MGLTGSGEIDGEKLCRRSYGNSRRSLRERNVSTSLQSVSSANETTTWDDGFPPSIRCMMTHVIKTATQNLIRVFKCLEESFTMSPPRTSTTLLVELCAGGINDVQLAAKFAVDRIELNCGMAVGGLTPSAGLVAAARRSFSGPIVSMVRPREAGFAYSDAEFIQMIDDCEFLLAAGLDGIAIGCLNADGTIDVQRCRTLRRLFPTATLVFHKAFDVTPNLPLAAQQLIDCGFSRILTSGGCVTAFEGRSMIRQLISLCGKQIEFVVGGGVRAQNLESIVRETGCDQIHSAVRSIMPDASTANNPALDFGGFADGQNRGYGAADETQLQDLMAAVEGLSGRDRSGYAQ